MILIIVVILVMSITVIVMLVNNITNNSSSLGWAGLSGRRPSPPGQIWIVVGGGDKGGLLVRKGARTHKYIYIYIYICIHMCIYVCI